MAWLRERLPTLVALLLAALGVAWCLHEAQYLAFSAPTGWRIVAEAGLDRTVAIAVESFTDGQGRVGCTDPEAVAEVKAWLRRATGKRQHDIGGPTEDEIWYLTFDDGREVDLHFWCASCPGAVDRPEIIAGVWLGREQCLLRLPRDEFYRLRERMGVE